MCVCVCSYKSLFFGTITLEIIHFRLSSQWTVVTDKYFDTFHNTVRIVLIIEPKIEKIVSLYDSINVPV